MDQVLFLAINHLPHIAIIDDLARFFSGIGQWGAIWFVIAVILFFREEERDHWFFLPTILATVLSLTISEILLKWIVARPRPTEVIGAIILTTPGNYSFPSTHATIAWAMAYVLSREEPRLRGWFYLLATVISLSRIYLGVHYPTDVIAGAFLGLGIGWGAIYLERLLRPKRQGRRRN